MKMNLDLLVQRSVALLQKHQPTDQPYYGCFSGGKDSVTIKELARLAGVNVVWYYNNTTIDPPELVHFIKKQHKDVVWNKPRHGNFFARMRQKLMMPTRFRRWCCAEYKEVLGPKKCTRILGVRVAESGKRAKRYTECTMARPAKRLEVYPIRLWEDEDVWSFIRQRKIPHCSLYDEGFTRLGCVGCPLASPKHRQREFDRWPRYAKKWKDSSWYIYEERKRRGMKIFPAEAVDGGGLYAWWMQNP